MAFYISDIIDGVKYHGLRPNLDELGAAEYVTKCIKACWHDEPEQRPDIRYVRIRLKEMQVGYYLPSFLFRHEKFPTEFIKFPGIFFLGRVKAKHIRQYVSHYGEICL